MVLLIRLLPLFLELSQKVWWSFICVFSELLKVKVLLNIRMINLS